MTAPIICPCGNDESKWEPRFYGGWSVCPHRHRIHPDAAGVGMVATAYADAIPASAGMGIARTPTRDPLRRATRYLPCVVVAVTRDAEGHTTSLTVRAYQSFVGWGSSAVFVVPVRDGRAIDKWGRELIVGHLADGEGGSVTGRPLPPDELKRAMRDGEDVASARREEGLIPFDGREEAEREARLVVKRQARFDKAHPEAAAALREYREIAATKTNPFLAQMDRAVTKNERLSPAQIAAIPGALARLKEEIALVATGLEPLKKGRRIVSGTITTVKQSVNRRGESTTRMTIQTDEGYRLNGVAIDSAKVGNPIRVRVTIKPQDDLFGFFSSPEEVTK